MCYIMAVKNGEGNKELKEVLLQTITEKMNTNSEGFVFRSKNKISKYLDFSDALMNTGQLNFDDLLCHFRLATTGKVDHNNIQGWTLEKYIFLHNGWVNGVSSGGRNQKKSDSLIFFEKLVKEFPKDRGPAKIYKAIGKTSKDLNFYGRALLLDTETDTLYCFGDFSVYVINNQTLIISSTKIDLQTINATEFVFGLGFPAEEKTNLDIKETMLNGVGMFVDWSGAKPQFEYLGQMPERDYGFNSDNWYKNKPSAVRLTDYNIQQDLQQELELEKLYAQ